MPAESEQKTLAATLSLNLRAYGSRVNALTGLSRSENHKSFDRMPAADECEDFHSECRKWASGVRIFPFPFLIPEDHDS